MRKPPTPLIVLDRLGQRSLQSQIVIAVKELTGTKVLRAGEAVPSTRELARDLRVSRNTVVRAYERLTDEGYLEALPRRGFIVSKSLAQGNRSLARPRRSAIRFPDQESRGLSAPRPFRPCQPDVRLFPLAEWNRTRARIVRANGPSLLNYQSHLPLGLPALRKTVADYVRERRGVRCEWEQVAITSGSQQALFLLAQLLLRPRSRVLMEDPGYRGAHLAWDWARASVRPVEVDGEGINISASRARAAELIYVTPSRQFPTGSYLSLPRRLALIELAVRLKALIIEDDYDSEFRYSLPPLPSLQSLDSFGRVIYVGSMSKVLFPSLRIGYLVLPTSLVDGFAALRSASDDHGPVIEQATLAEFIDCGAFTRHLRRSRRVYEERLGCFLDGASRLGLPLEFPHTDGGMNVAGFLDHRADDRKVAAELLENGLDVPALSSYSLTKCRPGLVFGFTAFAPSAIRSSLEVAGRVLERLRLGKALSGGQDEPCRWASTGNEPVSS